MVLLSAALVWWWVRRHRAQRLPMVSPPPLILIPPTVPVQEVPFGGRVGQRLAPAARQAAPADGAGDADGFPNGNGAGRSGAALAAVGAAAGDHAASVMTAAGAMPAITPRGTRTIDGAPTATVAAGTLRMLPGRLEFVEGPLAGSDVRFVHSGGTAEQRVTLGRGEGPPYEHVQIPSQTVSRLHAAMTYQDGRWSIANLSSTNPLRVNGLELASDANAIPLTNGDLIELGEVVFRFRS